jgi:nucleoside-diphosphate-sugar epimerase
MARVLIAGCGYVGTALGQRLYRDGAEVFGLRRDPSGLPPEIFGVAADLGNPKTLRDMPPNLDYIVYAAAPNSHDAEAYEAVYVKGLSNLLDALNAQGQQPKRVIFTSSTGVYGQNDGSWVDEYSSTRPSGFSGALVLEGEGLLLDSGLSATVLRLGGIYGPGRTRFIDGVSNGTTTCVDGITHYMNRQHLDDCVGALRHVMYLAHAHPIYLATDNCPADRSDVIRWLAETLGVEQPRSIPPIEAPKRLRGSNKRCVNDRLRMSGYTFRYPTYKEGYMSLIK